MIIMVVQLDRGPKFSVPGAQQHSGVDAGDYLRAGSLMSNTNPVALG